MGNDRKEGRMKITKKELIIVICAVSLLIILGALLIFKGSRELIPAMEADFKIQALYNKGKYDPNCYGSIETMHSILRAKNLMLVGAAIIGVGGGVAGIFFTCKWIRSLIK